MWIIGCDFHPRYQQIAALNQATGEIVEEIDERSAGKIRSGKAGAKARSRASAVVNISSVAGISGGGSSVAYAASKGALRILLQ